MTTGVRDWARVDFYETLGVAPGASDDEIAQAFRANAKQLHPDTSADPEATEKFKDLSAAYAVLSNRRTRRDYDRVRAEIDRPTRRPIAVATASATRGPIGARWSRRRAWTAAIGGAVVAILGVAAAFVTWSLHEHDANQLARFVPVTATRIDNGEITFVTRAGQSVQTREPHQHGEGIGPGSTVGVRYDPANPAHVIVDSNTLGRDITLGIVALKFLIGGPIFLGLGTRRLRARDVR